jgi:NAD(P)-dependent dehydrogenase (short-subunit alcohol dehydrogenase family)
VTRNDDWLELRDEVCVVTGAAGGLGVSIVRQLLQAGAAVALLDLDLTGAREVVAECDPEGTRTVMLRCDVTQAASVEEAVAAVGTKLGTPGVLVNNAGVIRAGALESIAIEDWQGQLDVNLTGYFRCAQLFGRQMLARGRGALVHIASIAAQHPQARGGAYAPAKAAICMLARQLALEWGPRGVRSNTVSPGLIRTPMTEASYRDPVLREQRRQLVPLQRFGCADDVASAVAFLASPRASYINGQDLAVDSGITQILMSQIPRADHGRQP